MKRRSALLATVGLGVIATGCAETTPLVSPSAKTPPAPPVPPPAPPALPASTAPLAADVPAPAPPAPSASSAAPAAVPLERVVARVGQNHGHVLEVTMADVKAGVPKTYDLTGTGSHAHAVTLDATHFARVAAGEIVRLPSTRTGHLHRLLVRLAPAVDPPEAANQCDIKIGGKDDHDLAITSADLAARAERSYDIQGIAPHNHVVKLTPDAFERLAKGEQVTVSSSKAGADDDHFHVVFIRARKA